MEDNLQWKTTSNGRRHPMEDDLQWKTTSYGRQPPMEDWEFIHRLGGWESFLVEFQMLEEISEQHKGAWVLAWVECLTKWRDADTEEGKETALL